MIARSSLIRAVAVGERECYPRIQVCRCLSLVPRTFLYTDTRREQGEAEEDVADCYQVRRYSESVQPAGLQEARDTSARRFSDAKDALPAEQRATRLHRSSATSTAFAGAIHRGLFPRRTVVPYKIECNHARNIHPRFVPPFASRKIIEPIDWSRKGSRLQVKRHPSAFALHSSDIRPANRLA